MNEESESHSRLSLSAPTSIEITSSHNNQHTENNINNN